MSTKAIPIHEAKTNLSKYVQRAKAGETIYIGRFGKTEAMLTTAPSKKKATTALWGAMKGQFNFTDEQWDETTRLVNKDFENSKIFPDAD